MAKYRKDEKGNLYLEGNGGTSASGAQLEGQLAFDQMGKIIEDSDVVVDDVVDMSTIEEETKALELLKDKNFDPRNFIDEFSSNSEKALNRLLAMQSNASPLKKGGVGVGFLCDILIINTRQLFNAQENTLFDIISATVSSRPEDESYIIYSRDVAPYFSYKDKNYINTILNSASESMSGKMIPFDVTLANGKTKTIGVHWNEMLLYTKPSEVDGSDESGYVAFKPTKLFKALLISSTIIHGAHYSLSVASQFKSYARILYYWFESKKNFCSYPGATPGRFYMTVEELRYLLKFPDSYRGTDVHTKILAKTKKKFDSTEGMDFVFDYKIDKRGRSIVGFDFEVTEIVNEKKLTNKEEAKTTPMLSEHNEPQEIAMLRAIGLNEKEQQEVYQVYSENKRDIAFLAQAIASVLSSSQVKNNASVLKYIMKNGLTKKENKKKGKFHNFNEREYDEEFYDSLEEQLLKQK